MRREELCGETIFLLHDFFSPEECDTSIAFSEGRGFEDATISAGGGVLLVKELRNNRRVMVDSRVLAARLFERARPFLPSRVDDWHLSGMNERFRYYRYDAGQRFKPHYDASFCRNAEEESQLTFMVYLNDDFTGGTTDFYRDDEWAPHLSVKPRRGTALVFVHHQLHEGALVTLGRKYALRTDVMYRVHPRGPVEANARLENRE